MKFTYALVRFLAILGPERPQTLLGGPPGGLWGLPRGVPGGVPGEVPGESLGTPGNQQKRRGLKSIKFIYATVRFLAILGPERPPTLLGGSLGVSGGSLGGVSWGGPRGVHGNLWKSTKKAGPKKHQI